MACPRLLFLPLADAGYCDACVWILRYYYLKEQFSREPLQSSNGERKAWAESLLMLQKGGPETDGVQRLRQTGFPEPE